MNIEDLVEYINRITPSRLVRFVSEQGENSCRDCLKHHNQIFEENDKDSPQLPIHPNCRCKYEYLTNGEVTGLKNELHQVKEQLMTYGNKIANIARQLLSVCQSNAKKHSIQEISNTIISTLPLAWKIYKAIQTTSDAVNKVDDTAEKAKLTSVFITFQITLAAMLKINQAAKSVEQEMEKLGNSNIAREIRSWANIHTELISGLRNWHYNRLALREQQLWALPLSPEEAIKRGFIKASNFENMYHRHKNQTDNVKYYNKKTGQEIIFDANGKVVTDVENIGTYNYYSPGNTIDNVLHIWADVLLYYIWGNDENDTTPLINRIFSRADLWMDLGREKYVEFVEKNKVDHKNIITLIKKIIPLFE